ncbi:uncharacterized protein LOC126803928 isoform X2 [Argentina anserina]|uniref:uncharacterized protein LOC126803928 isoform X2 n=1 Tax=Argentina anserina TaxID=57926 RepID=UPI0021765D86|nr:uncharacterized protein LOC126803928 isoform X2 [Potentilla anserina]
MSLENEDQELPDQPVEANHEVHKKLKISYTREFLLSLSGLESCKKLPDGLDQSFLSEFEDAFKDRQGTSIVFSANSFRRNDYGSSPPTKGDAAGYSRPLHGRWESRSSGRSDKDSDTQSDKDSDPGRHYGNPPRRPWQVHEHDGLLGSGSFPRPAGLAGGIAGNKVRPSDTYQLNRTSEPYQPPRPYKAAPLTRKEITDSLNDETFGSSEHTSEDRAEEERKRRDLFEQMRKEQHKAFQEKQKLKPEANTSGFDFSTLLDDDSKEKRLLPRSNETTEPRVPPTSMNDGEKSTLPLQAPSSRPLVPPGFTSTILERNLGTKSLNHPHQVEVGNSGLEDNILHGKGNRIVNGTSDNRVEKKPVEQMVLGMQHLASRSTHASFDSMTGKSPNFVPPQGAYNKIIGSDNQMYNKANTPQGLEASRNSEVIEIDAEKVTGSTSILEKLFSSAVPLNGVGSSNITEPHNSKVVEAVGPHIANSSKFAQWFHEDKKPADEILSGRPNDLLSLIVGSEKAGPHISDGKLHDHSFLNFPAQNSEPAERPLTSKIVPPPVADTQRLHKSTKPEAASAFLTCEDLEQSILSEIGESGPTLHPPVQKSVVPDRKAVQPKAKVDDHASLHLLSLLQKGTGLKDVEPSSNQETASSEQIHNFDGTTIGTARHTSKEKNADNVSDPGKSLTLETLFGTAFMKELQSVGAPVSSKRGLVGSARVEAPESHGLPFPVTENSYVPSAFDIGPNTSTHDNSDMAANRRKQTRSDKIDEQFVRFDNPQIDLDSLQVRTDSVSKISIDGPADIRLPEEDSLLVVSEPLNVHNFMSTGNLVKSKELSSRNSEVDIVEKLAALNSAFKDERSIMGNQEGPPFLRGPYDMRQPDIPYQNLNVQPSSQNIHHHQMNHRGTLFHPSDSHPGNANSQMNFMTPEGMIRNDPPQSHQFPGNMLRPPFHHANAGQSGFDAHHHPMLQQMHTAGSFPLPHLLQGLSSGPAMPPHPNRVPPLPAHPNSQVSSFMEELNPMAGYPFGPRPVNLGGHGMPAPAPDVAGGSNHPAALQRLHEMELRSNPKQIHPFASGGGHNSQGMYGHELGMGFGYR